jgi:hypothetical protein
MDTFKRKLMIQGGITAIMLLVLVGGVVYFGMRITSYSKEIASVRGELTSRSNSLNSVAALRSEYRTKAKRGFDVMYATVPTQEQLINLRQELQLLASRENISLTYSYLNETNASKDTFGTYNFRLDLSGDFNKLIAFIDTLQTFRYLSVFDSPSIIRSGSNGSLTIKGRVYYRDDSSVSM